MYVSSVFVSLNENKEWTTVKEIQDIFFLCFFFNDMSNNEGTGSTTPNRTKENDVSLLLEMVE